MDGSRFLKTNVMLLGFTVPDSVARAIFAMDTNPAVQTHKFAWSLARALQLGFGEVVLVSCCPIQNYPLGGKVFFGGAEFDEGGIKGYLLGFVNILILKHVTRLVSCLLRVPSLIARYKVEWLFVHGTHSPFLIFGILARFFGVRLVVVVTDPPSLAISTDNFLVQVLKRLDAVLLGLLVARSDGVIALAPQLARRLAPNRPALIFPGILSSKMLAYVVRKHGAGAVGCPFTIIYAGGLNEAYGVDRLIDAVLKITDIPVRIKFFGRGDQELRIRALANKDTRVQYGGFVDDAVLIPELQAADLLINPRPTSRDFSVMSFPSKLIEYLAMNRPVLTTRISSIPPNYLDHFFLIDDESVEGIRRAILSVMGMSPSELRSRALRGQAFIFSEASEGAVGAKIAEFVHSAVELAK